MKNIFYKKILPQYFEEVLKGNKDFELRKDEDDIQVGDRLVLNEFDGNNYTGQYIAKDVKYILRDCPQYGLMNGYCIIGLGETRTNRINILRSRRMSREFSNTNPDYKYLAEIREEAYSQGRADAIDEYKYSVELFREMFLEELERQAVDREEIFMYRNICSMAWNKYLEALKEQKDEGKRDEVSDISEALSFSDFNKALKENIDKLEAYDNR